VQWFGLLGKSINSASLPNKNGQKTPPLHLTRIWWLLKIAEEHHWLVGFPIKNAGFMGWISRNKW
jgi:hypothetical protein